MSTLQKIYLGANTLAGPMPSIFFNMSSLQTIQLRYNMLSGGLPTHLFDHLPNLQYFSVLNNHFSGELPEIGNLTMLTELHLAYNNFEGTIPSSLLKCKQLQMLNLRGNNFRGRVPPQIGNLTMLTKIDLNHNKFEGTIPSSLFKCKQLQILSLRADNFTGRVPPEIGNLTMLTTLDLSNNKFEGAIPSEIGSLQNLEFFAIDSNGFAGLIPFEIFNISTIQVIGMLNNKLSGHLPSNIGLFLPNLRLLFLGINKLSGTIPSSISNASQLTDLDLVANSFSGLIPKTLGNLRLLQWLNLGLNNLTVESSKLSLFSYLSNCIYLKTLALSNIHLNGFLPNSIGNLSLSLQILHLDNCNIEGNIPIEIGNLSSLMALKLSDNELTGPIPATIGRLRMLQSLKLDGNRLKGLIPSNLCHLGSLAELLLGDNELSGHIPACISTLTSLRDLDFGFNQLTSTIPSSLWSLTDLLRVKLSSNSLSGSLPPEIGNLKVLILLDLSRNQLSGDIPITIGGLKDLTDLSLAVNRLEGSIPVSFSKMVSLKLLDLSHNNLSGEIPETLEELLYLKYLDVSFNRLRGKIPTGGPFVHFSAISFMSNDALCGAPRLQVPPCGEGTRKKKVTVLYILKYALPAIGLTMLAAALALAWTRCKKRNPKFPVKVDSYPLGKWRRISHQELVQATEGFRLNNLLGEGSFGSVYKGKLSDGMNIAIKVVNLQVKGAFKSFDVECEVLRNIRHRNLVKIISICSNIDFKALVLEYMPNGNLEKWLYSRDHCLDILQRLNIMIDVASALEYLHDGYSTTIVHCDLKPTNILLDEDMVAHVADFGMAKLLGDGDSMMQTMTLASFGYMAPEYGLEGIVSTRGDVYSYGILLMETFTRKKPTDDMFTGEMSLKHWVAESLPISIIDIADANLLRNKSDYAVVEECISSIMRLALDCCAESPEQRINIRTVSAMLRKIKLKSLRDIDGS